jgi:hypothetical protein
MIADGSPDEDQGFAEVQDEVPREELGDGEWQAHKHKTSNQRRSWRKLHLGIDGDNYIIASALTDRVEDDACVAISMLEQIKGNIARSTADGAYDSRPMYKALAASGAHQQARAENGMYRYKRIIGDRLRAKHRESQKKEALIAVNVINRMTALGYAGIS